MEFLEKRYRSWN